MQKRAPNTNPQSRHCFSLLNTHAEYFLFLTSLPHVCICVAILKINLIILSTGTLPSSFLQACWSSFSAVKIRVWVADNRRICYRNPRWQPVSFQTGIFKVRQQRLKSLSSEAHVSVPVTHADPPTPPPSVMQRELLMQCEDCMVKITSGNSKIMIPGVIC